MIWEPLLQHTSNIKFRDNLRIFVTAINKNQIYRWSEDLGPDIVLFSWAGDVGLGPVSHNLAKTRFSNFNHCIGLSVKCSGLKTNLFSIRFWLSSGFKTLTCVCCCPSGQSKGQCHSQRRCSEYKITILIIKKYKKVNAAHKCCSLNTKFDHNSTS